MKAADIASKAAELVGGERAHVHGDKVINHDKIAAMWNGVLFAAGKVPAVPLDGHDVANMMEALKIARRYLGRFNPDDYVDGAGYAACAGEIAAAAEAQLESHKCVERVTSALMNAPAEPRLSVVGGAETNP